MQGSSSAGLSTREALLSARFSSFWADNEQKLIAAVEHEMAGQSTMPMGGWDRVGKALGVPGDACAQKYRRVRQGATVATEPQIKPPVAIRDVHDFIDMPPRPFQVPIAKGVTATPGKPFRAVVIGDRQVPFDDKGALKVAIGIIKDVQPHVLLDMGDDVDCWQISDYDRDPARMGTLQDDIDADRTVLHQLAQAAPKARRVLLEGNHNDRLRRLIWRLPGGAAELARLRVFQQTMTWPFLLGLQEIGWEWVAAADQSHAQILPKLIAIHGHQVGGTVVEGGMARKAIQKYGRSVILGHGHRACVIVRRDHNGQSFGIETGCLCDLDRQPYGFGDANWQNTVTVIEWTASRKLMATTQVHIREGRALWQGTELAA